MRQILRVVAVGAALGAGAVAAVAQDVKVNWREKAAFGDFRTFQILPVGQNTADPLWTQFVPKYVTSALEAKGLNPVQAGQVPDLKVAYHFRERDLVDRQTTSDGFGWGGGPWGGWGGWGGYGGWGGPDWATTREVPRTMGVLTVDLVEARSNEVVWRGKATEDRIADSQHKNEDQVWKSVGKMFEHYPPKPEKNDK